MATIRRLADFRDFLKLLNSHRVEYLPGSIIRLPDLLKKKFKIKMDG